MIFELSAIPPLNRSSFYPPPNGWSGGVKVLGKLSEPGLKNCLKEPLNPKQPSNQPTTNATDWCGECRLCGNQQSYYNTLCNQLLQLCTARTVGPIRKSDPPVSVHSGNCTTQLVTHRQTSYDSPADAGVIRGLPIDGYQCRTLRGAVVEWLERLDYGAESRRKIMSSRLGFAIRRLEHSL